jgi:membrane protease subunit HflK
MRGIHYTLLAGGFLLTAYLLTGITQIRPGERAVVRRFGRIVAKPGPGLHLGLPYGMDRVDRIPVDFVRPVRVGYDLAADESDEITPPGQLLTGDHNLVNVQVVLDYTVNDAQIEDYVVQAERVDAILARTAEAVLAEWVAERKVDDVLIQGKAELPAFLVRRTQQRIEPYRLGVVIQNASISYLFPPDEVRRAFDDVTRAQTAMRTQENQARQEAAQKVRSARAAQHRIEQLTAAYIKEQRVLAQAEAANFEQRLAQYRKLRRDNPSFLAGLWWDEIGKLFTQMKATGRIDLLDNHLGGDGLDITISPAMPRKQR